MFWALILLQVKVSRKQEKLVKIKINQEKKKKKGKQRWLEAELGCEWVLELCGEQ